MKIIRKAIEKVLAKIIEKIKWQNIFEQIYFVLLHGMNIGLGGDYVASGEKNVLQIIFNKYKNINSIIVFDVGVNLGNYSIMVNEVFGNKLKIFAFEPSKKHFY